MQNCPIWIWVKVLTELCWFVTFLFSLCAGVWIWLTNYCYNCGNFRHLYFSLSYKNACSYRNAVTAESCLWTRLVSQTLVYVFVRLRRLSGHAYLTSHPEHPQLLCKPTSLKPVHCRQLSEESWICPVWYLIWLVKPSNSTLWPQSLSLTLLLSPSTTEW